MKASPLIRFLDADFSSLASSFLPCLSSFRQQESPDDR